MALKIAGAPAPKPQDPVQEAIAKPACTSHLWMGNQCVKCKASRPDGGGKAPTPLPKKIEAPTPPPGPPAALSQPTNKPTKKLVKPEWVEKPWPEGKPYTIFDAIKEKWDGRPGTLMLSKLSSGESFKVEKVRFITGESVAPLAQVDLSSSNGMTFSPRIGEREIAQYAPVWR